MVPTGDGGQTACAVDWGRGDLALPSGGLLLLLLPHIGIVKDRSNDDKLN